ncbi:MAG: arginine--tRNA ligase [Candidatus Micrarchaeota archaeon]|nr:arginine--tRNA ligase [Candidatus Micrarchaeota archaeon]
MLYQLKEEITELLLLTLREINNDDQEITAEELKKSILVAKFEIADMYSNFLFELSNKLKKMNKKFNIQEKGEMIAKKFNQLALKKNIGVEASYLNGYLNFYLKNKAFKTILETDTNVFLDTVRRHIPYENYVIEFPSVNPNKPWHVGHLRNALVGQAIAKLLKKLGKNVVIIDYIDDLGLQFAQTVFGIKRSYSQKLEEIINQKQIYLNDSEKARQDKDSRIDFFMGKVYVEINKLYPEDSEDIKKLVESMEKDNDVLIYSRKLAELCLLDQYLTANLYGITRDLIVFESDIIRFLLKNGIELLKENKLITHVTDVNDQLYNCYVIDVSSFKESKEGKKVLIRSNGTLTYTGKDLIFHLWKYGILNDNIKYSYLNFYGNKIVMSCFYASEKERLEFKRPKADVGLVVIGSEQKFPQKIIAHALNILGYKINHVHIAYGHVRLKEGHFSGRKGTWIGYTAEELFEECFNREKEILKNNQKLSEEQKERVAKLVALAAIKYYFLKYEYEKEIVFDWDNALSLKGNSGPYILYSVVRAKGILSKVEEISENIKEIKNHEAEEIFYELKEEEKNLLRQLARFQEVILNSATSYSVNQLIEYMTQLCDFFNKFYDNCRVINEENKMIKNRRILIVKQFYVTMRILLDSLNIEETEIM